MPIGEKQKPCSEAYTVHVRMGGERETHAVDVGGVDTVGTVLEKSAEVLRVDKRYLTLLHDGTPLDDLTQGVTGTTLCEGSEVEARVKELTVVRLLSDDVEEEAEAAVSASLDDTLYLDVCGWQEGPLKLPELPEDMRHLILIDTDPGQTDITSIEDGFLGECTSLQSLDLSPLSGVTKINESFLEECTSLQSLDLAPLSGVTKISGRFLYGCTSLQSLDLSPLSGVTKINRSFLYGCTSLQSLDLSPLSGVTSIEYSFLHGCTSLQSLDLSPLSGVTSIGNHFLSGCTSFQSLDLSPLSGVTSIENSFLHGCTSLQSLDLSPLSGVTKIGSLSSARHPSKDVSTCHPWRVW